MFFHALLLGLLISLPVGPVAILILQRSLRLGRWAGIASGLGAATADAIFALLASAGVVVLFGWIEESIVWIRPVGGCLLMGLGLFFFFQKPPRSFDADEPLSPRYLHHYLWDSVSTLLLVLTNPLTVLAMAALFASSDLIPTDPRRMDFIGISSGVACGSFLWWCMVVTLSAKIKQVVSPQKIHRLMQGLAILLMALGGTALGSTLLHIL